MTTYGVTPTGFVRPTLHDILALIEGDQRANISQGLDQSPESPLGQNNAIFARQLAIAWEQLEIIYNGNDPDRAEDFMLTALCKLTGTSRDAATKSTVPVSVNLDSGTTLIAGQHFAHVAGKPNVRFTPREDVTADSGDGDYQTIFEAELTGPVQAALGTLTTIATQVVGWNSITNTTVETTLGTVADDDPTLRIKREAQIAAAGNQTAQAIVSDLLALTYDGNKWVKSARVFENVAPGTDIEGRPEHSFEVLVYDDVVLRPSDADDQISQVIWNNKPAGIWPWGDGAESGFAVNELGASVSIGFSRVSEVAIYIDMTLTAVYGFSDFASVKDAIVAQASAAYDTPGADVIALFVKAIALSIDGVFDVPSFAIGTSPSPAGSANISIGIREVAKFTSANITIS